MTRVLVSWVGQTDLLSMAGQVSATNRKKVLNGLGRESAIEGRGPVKTLVDSVGFDEVQLLCNYPKSLGQMFAKWIGETAKLRHVAIKNPTDYKEVFQCADGFLDSIKKKSKPSQLCIHLSPGTPTMVAVWVLLGKSKYPAKFYQTYRDKLTETDIPFDLAVDYVPELLRDADNALQHLAERSPQEIRGFDSIVGESRPIRIAVGRAAKAAIRDIPVLVQGESGTGKEVFARAIHEGSRRNGKKFVAINCAAIPRELLESTLFGHKKGAFTGATEDRAGAFEQADGGTLFLDEVGECDAAMQAKLLRALQPPPGAAPSQKVFQRVGESKDRKSDVRILSATNRNLIQLIASGVFREDLYYRLAVIVLKLPPLRERRTDISLLAKSLLDQINREFASQEPGYEDRSLSKEAMAFIRKHTWPGNVRQLNNVLTQAAVMANSTSIRKSDVAEAIAESPVATEDLLELPLTDDFQLDELLNRVHQHYLRRALDEAAGVKSRARRLLGLPSDQNFAARLKRLGVEGS